MQPYQLSKIIQLTIASYQGNEFQKFGNRLMTVLYPDQYHATRAAGPNGDFGNDGYCPSERIFFHFYGPERGKINKLKMKISSDINKCLQFQQDVKKIFFVTNDMFLGEIESHIDKLRKDHGIVIQTLGIDWMVNKMKDMGMDNIEFILGMSINLETNKYITYQVDAHSVKSYSSKKMKTGLSFFVLSFLIFMLTNIWTLIAFVGLYQYILLFISGIAIFAYFKYFIMYISHCKMEEIRLRGLFSIKFFKPENGSYLIYNKSAKCPSPECKGVVGVGLPPFNEKNRLSAVGYCSLERTLHTYSVSEDNKIGYPIQLDFTLPKKG